MKRWKLYIISALLMVFVSFLYGFAQYKNTTHKIEKVQVHFIENEPAFLTSKMVNKLLIQSNPKLLNEPKTLINLHKLEENLRKNEMVENAELYIGHDDVLKVAVTQRVPVLRVQSGDKIFYIDRQGKKMPLSPNYSARVPLVTGVLNEDALQDVFELVNIFNEDSFYKKQIIGIKRNSNGDYVLNTRIGRHQILFGKNEKARKKLKKLKVFYKKEWETETLNKYKLINLKYDRQVVCSK